MLTSISFEDAHSDSWLRASYNKTFHYSSSCANACHVAHILVELRVRNVILIYHYQEQQSAERCSLTDTAVTVNLVGCVVVCTSPLGVEVDKGGDPLAQPS